MLENSPGHFKPEWPEDYIFVMCLQFCQETTRQQDLTSVHQPDPRTADTLLPGIRCVSYGLLHTITPDPKISAPKEFISAIRLKFLAFQPPMVHGAAMPNAATGNVIPAG